MGKSDSVAVAALLDRALAGYTATTARGIRMGIAEPELVKLLGKPTTTHRDQDMGGARRLTELWFEPSIDIEGVDVHVTVSWDTKPVDRGVTSVSLKLTGNAASAALFRDAFAGAKERLAAIYKKGENKSTFKAPGLALGDDPGFVAVFHYAAKANTPPMLVINAGVLE